MKSKGDWTTAGGCSIMVQPSSREDRRVTQAKNLESEKGGKRRGKKGPGVVHLVVVTLAMVMVLKA